MSTGWKILLGVKLAQLYLEMTKLSWVGWVTGTATFQAEALVWVFITLLTIQALTNRDSGVACLHFLHEEEGDKVENSHRGMTILPSANESSCLLFITLIKLWQVSGCCFSLPKARTESYLTAREFMPFLIESLDPNSETSGDLSSMINMSSSSSFWNLFPREQDGVR